MRWIKKGVIFRPDGRLPWMRSHACVPTADLVDDRTIRIYFAPRDGENRSRVTFLETDADDPARVRYVHDRPALDLGALGTFDDSGVMPCSLVRAEGRLSLYYVGWNRTVTVPYRNAVGVAVSEDGGRSFRRLHEGPVLDRTPEEPFFTASPFAMRDAGTWKMWYASATGWTVVDGRPEPRYQIKYAESADGVHWTRNNVTCIPYRTEGEANARPCVRKEGGRYRMWYCYRGSVAYRTSPDQSYRIGYAESEDGVRWTRRDEAAGLARSETGWDATMQAYPFVCAWQGRRYLFYNGNGFGETGIGYAVLDDAEGA